MAQQPPLPSEATLQAFAERLGEFRGSLNDEHQRLLDTMIRAALRGANGSGATAAAAETSEVTPFWTNYSGVRTSPNPSWYNSSGAAAWNNTSWGTEWLNYP